MDLSKMNVVALERELDHLYEINQGDSELAKAINDELNHRAERYTEQSLKAKARELKEEQDRHEEALQQVKDAIAEKYGTDFQSWIDWAKSQYIIHPNWMLESKAANWKEQKTWSCNGELGAIKKLEELLGWKYYDHFVRERGLDPKGEE